MRLEFLIIFIYIPLYYIVIQYFNKYYFKKLILGTKSKLLLSVHCSIVSMIILTEFNFFISIIFNIPCILFGLLRGTQMIEEQEKRKLQNQLNPTTSKKGL